MTNLGADGRAIGYLALLLVIAGNSAGNVLLKIGADATRRHGSGIAAMLNWPTVAGVACFALSVVAYSWALQRFQLHNAQITVSIQYVLVIVAAWWLLGERIAPSQWLGIALIAGGIFLCTRGPL